MRLWTPSLALPPSLLLGLGLPVNPEELVPQLLERGWFWTFLSLFVLGLALNLTPCVYPMIPITLGFFSRQVRGKTAYVWLLAVLYVLGLAATYSALAVAAALTGRILGEQLQHPAVLVAVAAVLVALALSQFGVYVFRLPGWLVQRLSGAGGAGPLGALGMGLVVGVVASPCVGPVTAGLLVYVGTAGDPWLGFWMFFVLALGMGAPYLVLAAFTGWLARLPRAGAWLVWVERLFGFVLLGLALYYVSPLLPGPVLPWAVSALAATAGVYLGWLESSRTGGWVFPLLKKVVGLACLVVAVVAVWPRDVSAEGIAWQPYDPTLLQQAGEQGRPVLLDFYADWCLPCQEMERTTYRDPRVIQASQAFLMVKVDLTNYRQSAEAQRLIREYDVDGVPTLLFLDRQGKEIKEARWVGYLDAEGFLEKVRQVQEKS